LPFCKLVHLKFFHSTGITFGSKLLVALVNFVIVVLLSQWLGDAGKGRCSLYLLIFSTALIFCSCISGAAIGYLLSKYSHRQLLLQFYGWSAIACLLTGLAFGWLGKINSTETLWVILINWLNAVAVIHPQVALGRQKLRLFNGLNILQALLTLVAVVIIFLHIKREPLGYLWALFAAWIITGAVGFVAIYFLPDQHKFTSWKLLTGEGFKYGVANQAGTFMQLINTRIAYLLLPEAGTGIYSNAVSLCEASLLINASIGTVQYSRVVQLNNNKEQPQEQIRKQQVTLTQKCFWLNALLMLVALIMLAVLPASLYAWLFGPAFEAVAEPLRLLLPGIFLYSCFIIFSYFFSGTGRFGINNFPALAALLATLLSYGTAHLMSIPVSVPLAALIAVISYTTLFIVAIMIFFKQEKMTLRKWIQIPLGIDDTNISIGTKSPRGKPH
jgi:O-antigen/teichoic acid export membrane protein